MSEKSKGHYVATFFRLIYRFLRGVVRVLDRAWQNYQEDRAVREMERRRLRNIAREGAAYGYGFESGRRRATSNYYERKRQQDELRRQADEWHRDPFGIDHVNKSIDDSTRWFLGIPPRKKKRRS